MEVIFLIGLPGSGKSSYIKEKYSNRNLFSTYDDVKRNAVINNGDFAYSSCYPEIITLMREGTKNIVISDIDFCKDCELKKVKEIINWWASQFSLVYQIKSIFFKNDPEQCKLNLNVDTTRNNQSRIESINKYSQNYTPDMFYDPACDLIIDVYSE